MAVVLRLARHGRNKRPFYRIVAADKLARRDGKFLDILGTYNPMVEPPEVVMKEDRVRKWINEGAKASRLVRHLITKQIPQLVEEKEEKQLAKIRERRKKRKQRAAA